MSLPVHLAERVEPGAPPPRPEGRYVICWLRVTQRALENPALDVALAAGRSLKLPVFVYHALSERYPYASDRHHTFFLEGARALQRALVERGVGFVFHLERPGHRRPRLLELAQRAALVVVDAFPKAPHPRWDAAVAKVAPVWKVDSACLAPAWLLAQRYLRVADFAHDAGVLWRERIARPWRDEPAGALFVPEPEGPPLDLTTADLPALVAACDIDHGVAPVHHTRGGTPFGLERWRRFVDDGLGAYAQKRHAPLEGGTSRISAYLHFGQLSPFRVARDCAAHRSDGAEKFLEELLTWRELAWNVTRSGDELETVAALPAWARTTLADHEADPRLALPSREQLARAQTGLPLWDACQRSLLTHGELHHALRMTWAKAALGLTRTAAEALAVLFDLNDRYALDGRDPSSTLGILWCLGAYDAPFSPEVPVLGAVRPRPLEEQSARLDLAELTRRVRRPTRGAPLTVAVVGAGVAGAAAARALADAGNAVTVFEREREVGGRAATAWEASHRVEAGAPGFTAKDERFARWVRAWRQERLVADWEPRTGGDAAAGALPLPWLVGTPSLGALVERMLAGLDVHLGARVVSLRQEEGHLRLSGEQAQSLGEFDAVVVAAPAPQAAELVDALSWELATRIRQAQVTPCHAMVLDFAAPLPCDFDALTVPVGPLAFLARESSKPDRPPQERWVLHAAGAWSQQHAQASPDEVRAALLDAFWAASGAPRVEPQWTSLRFFPWARVARPLGESCLFDGALRLSVCGDYCLGDGVEAAFLSGTAAAGRLNALGAEAVETPHPSPPHRAAQLRLL